MIHITYSDFKGGIKEMKLINALKFPFIGL